MRVGCHCTVECVGYQMECPRLQVQIKTVATGLGSISDVLSDANKEAVLNNFSDEHHG